MFKVYLFSFFKCNAKRKFNVYLENVQVVLIFFKHVFGEMLIMYMGSVQLYKKCWACMRKMYDEERKSVEGDGCCCPLTQSRSCLQHTERLCAAALTWQLGAFFSQFWDETRWMEDSTMAFSMAQIATTQWCRRGPISYEISWPAPSMPIKSRENSLFGPLVKSGFLFGPRNFIFPSLTS